MGKRVNYGFQKRQRELKKQKKKEEKAERKRQEALDKIEGEDEGSPSEDASDSE